MTNTDGNSLAASVPSASEPEEDLQRSYLNSGVSVEAMLAEAVEGEKIPARKLTFPEQCGAFAALYAGVRNQVVARAFGVSVQCASNLSGCLEFDPDPYREFAGVEKKVLMDHNRNRKPDRRRHYEPVGREFEALGLEEFNRRYYTERVHKRIILAKEEIRRDKRGDNGVKGRRPYDPERDNPQK